MEKHRASAWIAAIGFALLLICVGWTAVRTVSSDIPNAQLQECRKEVVGKVDWRTAHTTPSVLAVWPERTAFNRTICIVVAGIVSPATQPKEAGGVAPPKDATPQNAGGVLPADTGKPADEAATRPAPPVRVYLFLNNLRADHIKLMAKPIATPQTFLVSLQQQEDFTEESARFWRELLHSGTSFSAKTISVGISRVETDTAEASMDNATTLVVLDLQVAILGGLAFVFLVGAFVLYAKNSSLLRDDKCIWTKSEIEALISAARSTRDADIATETPEQKQARITATDQKIKSLEADLKRFPTRGRSTPSTLRCTYSLAKSQMAFWLILSTTGFLFIWLTTGQYYNLITGGLLVLLGISGTTGLAAIQLADQAADKRQSAGFINDIFSDAAGPQLYRLQSVAWTVVLGVIFVWHVMYNFRFAEFDTNLLIMIGISQSLYLGFKARDKYTST